MGKTSVRRIYAVLAYLVGCAFRGEKPDAEYLSGLSVDDIYACAKRHKVDALTCVALESLGLATAKMIDKKNRSIRKVMLLDAERGAILSELEKRGIKYMPLKGVYMKEYYPMIGLRQMTDNDILFDKTYRADVRDIMVERGFEIEVYDKSPHDVYVKEPVYNFEMHVALFDKYRYPEAAEYYDGAFDRAVRIEGTSYGYRMSDEDFYMYMRAHEYKHFVGGGTGFRSLLDTYVLRQALKDRFNDEYVSETLEKFGMGDYEKKARILSERLFDPEKIKELLADSSVLSEEEWWYFGEFCMHGAYGTVSNHINLGIAHSESKFKYVWGRLFPPMIWYKAYHPTVYKYKILIVPFLLVRFFRLLLVHPTRFFSYMKSIIKYKGKNADESTRK